MNTYKITNTTNLLGKRDPKFNSITNIEYIDDRMKKIKTLKPSESVFLTVQSLPLSVRRLGIKKVIDIIEVSPAELNKSMGKTKPKASSEPEASTESKVVKKSTVKKNDKVDKKNTTRKKNIVNE